MIVGIDFDNTLVNYDNLFYNEAIKRQLLPSETNPDKQAVRDALRALGRDEDFTLIQGHVYGPGILEAQPYPGAKETVAALLQAGYEVYVVSHKTRFPYRGPQHDLHLAALSWLEAWQFFAPGMLSPDKVFLESTLQSKLQRIDAPGCAYFIDDLPELLCHPDFPQSAKRILFDPHEKNAHAAAPVLADAFSKWSSIKMHLLEPAHSKADMDCAETQSVPLDSTQQ